MRHLFNSRCEVLRINATMTDGAPTVDWNKVDFILDPYLGVSGELLCRLDLQFLRPGRDTLPPLVAGRAQDRFGVMFLSATTKLRSGDRVRTLTGPVTGTFEIRNVPDPAVGMGRTPHHFEVQVIEVAQSVDQPMKVITNG